MATRSKAITTLQTYGDKVWTVLWTGLLQSPLDDGDPFEMPGAPDRSVQVTGTFGVGGNVRIEGCNETTPTNWAVLTDPQGNALDVTTAKIEAITELVRWIRPRVTAGDGTTTLAVTILARRPK